MVACQPAPQPIPDENDGTTTITYTGSLEPCTGADAGTLNCYVDLPEIDVDVQDILSNPQTAYGTCMYNCLASLNCIDTNTLSVDDFDATAIPTSCTEPQINSCTQSCDAFSDPGIISLPSSDPLGIPQNAKAITIKVQSCLDKDTSFFQFKGASMGTRKFAQGKYSVRNYGSWLNPDKKVRIPYQVGSNYDCPSARRGQALVRFTPYKEQAPYALGSQNFDTIAFSDNVADEINQTWKAPHLTALQLPKQLMSELDLSEVSWVLKSVDTPNPTVMFGLPAYNAGFSYFENGQTYGDSIVAITPYFSESLSMDFTMVVFIKAQQ